MSERNPCQSCSAPASLAICNRCIEELKANLTCLYRDPKGRDGNTSGLLDALSDVALKKTRMTDGGSGHLKKGDERPDPFEPDTEKGKQTAQGRAATLLITANNTLSTIVRDLCESRGIVTPAGLLPTRMAEWLAAAVHAIACDESAGQWYADIDRLVRSIERAVDRPVRYELLGLCATQLEGNKACDTALMAREDAIEVRCPNCRTVRRCDIVRRMGQSEARKALIAWPKLLETNRGQPDGWRVSERTLRDWKATGVLRVRGYLRPSGRHGIHRRSDDDVELFAWVDVEQLRSRGVPKGHRKRAKAGK
ncbi:hypothetical protein [Mycobacterium sp. PSTR-4-N]|uniref:hypothetical protein n=1 Tax=Mycobacterium sp. PSTR-4-N TaxID=2917745 RepID=UPI001F154B6E|nr:hypothetical protein [Mycobacterium sp. PSTR-4-N]MCG7596341.1 hypothetical protein [Mycobacterium sp. PSTR-4-N]